MRFDAELAQQAVDEPFSVLSSDPLADAWGLEPHATVSVATFGQAVPKRDMLYLDKAWRGLQALIRPALRDSSARASYHMFEGDVTMRAWGWDPWVRTILPEEVPVICEDLRTVGEAQVETWVRSAVSVRDVDEELRYVLDYLARAKEFVNGLEAEGRVAYEIG